MELHEVLYEDVRVSARLVRVAFIVVGVVVSKLCEWNWLWKECIEGRDDGGIV